MNEVMTTTQRTGSYVFRFRAPPELSISTVGSVLVGGTFNGWRLIELERVKGKDRWKGNVSISIPDDTKYFLYKYYVRYDWATATTVPNKSDEWMIDCTQPVMLQSNGGNSNYLDVSDMKLSNQYGQNPVRDWSGSFEFSWPSENAQLQSVVARVRKKPDAPYQSIPLWKSSKGWSAYGQFYTVECSLSSPITYYYEINGKRAYNSKERMGKDSNNRDCNILLSHDLTVAGSLGETLPVHELDFRFYTSSSSTEVVLFTSVDNYQSGEKLVPPTTETRCFSLSTRISGARGTKLYYYLICNKDRRQCFDEKPVVEQNGLKFNYHVLGMPFLHIDNVLVEDHSDEFGRYTFVWPGDGHKDSKTIWVIGTFNSWRKSDQNQMVRSPDGTNQTVTLILPLRRTLYKYLSDKGLFMVNPLARIERDILGKTRYVNYLLPEDMEPIVMEEEIPTSEFKSENRVPLSRLKSKFPLSPRAAEARGM